MTSTIDWNEIHTPKTGLVSALGAIKSVDIPDPPKFTFFSGVFNILWRKEIVFRWLRLSIFFEITFFFLMMMTSFGLVAAACFLLPVFFLGLWSVSYATNVFQTVLIDTANGHDRILDWPDADWRIYAIRSYQMLFVYFASMCLSWMLTHVTLYFKPSFDFWISLASFYLALTPVMILSTEESGSHWNFFTSRVLKTLITCWWGWGFLYLSLAVMWGFTLNILLTAVTNPPSFHLYLLAAMLFPVCFIYSGRIMGRLLWRSIVVPSQKVEVVEKPVVSESLHPEEY